ncbi:MAG: DNA-binding protein WhiA [Clostridia bacterium]|nr:DNA-binding protein WhiA [Clostridia bacterium]
MTDDISISQLVKEDIIEGKIPNVCCKKAFLSGLIRGAGNYYVNSSGFGINVQHQSPDLITKCAQMVKQLISFEPTVKMRQQEREVTTKRDNSPKTVYELELPGTKCFDLLEEAYISPAPFQLYEGIAPELIESPCCAKAFLQGAFLASGTISIPSADEGGSAGYYLDITLTSEIVAEDLLNLLNNIGLDAKLRKRGETYSVYLKDAEKISDMCALMGAMRAVLEIQNTLVLRSIRNDANRQANCANANIDKSIEAGLKQVAAIELIDRKIGLSALDQGLRDTALARVAHPEMSLNELASVIEGNPSKSCLNHRMRKLVSLAEELENN